MGQLFDYGVRYRAEIGRAQPVLAFGEMPSRHLGWIFDDPTGKWRGTHRPPTGLTVADERCREGLTHILKGYLCRRR